MLIVVDQKASEQERAAVWSAACGDGRRAYALAQGQAIVVPEGHAPGAEAMLRGLRGVVDVRAVASPYPLVSRELQPTGSIVQVGPVAIGGPAIVLMAGPCAVENEAQLLACAAAAQRAGATMLRGGAYKPRTSPYAFDGLKEAGLALLAQAGHAYDLRVVTEVMDARDVPLVSQYADMLQIGARNMQNFSLLQAVGRVDKPVLLKRGLSATYQEWLLAAEHICASGNPRVVLCERGIRSFETRTRNVLDLAAVPALKELTHLPIVVDPSHGTGRRSLVTTMAKGAVAVGADGIMVECHPDPDAAWSDGAQSLTFAGLAALGQRLGEVAACVGRNFRTPPSARAEI